MEGGTLVNKLFVWGDNFFGRPSPPLAHLHCIHSFLSAALSAAPRKKFNRVPKRHPASLGVAAARAEAGSSLEGGGVAGGLPGGGREGPLVDVLDLKERWRRHWSPSFSVISLLAASNGNSSNFRGIFYSQKVLNKLTLSLLVDAALLGRVPLDKKVKRSIFKFLYTF